ncbi:P-loop containing nucleoside triphosphate hydrolase protein [Trametes coccinea BRFM310]|uniref:RNA helicase n=1 Tax=Trametes coccinea (strain BRFM310) TaxID=1353009 RepID=A0A1Y2IWV4_TRAC3|nr:P-loop containing nucleoside triphosphate hydrolase protein [Trametes coccinea BRFM310]
MSLLSSSRCAVRSATLPPELLVACLHTSTPVYVRGQRTAGGSAPSRTRLVKDLTPTGASGKLKVARQRDPPPHTEKDRRNDGYSSKMSQRLSRREEAKLPVTAPTSSRDLPQALRLSSGPHARDVMRNSEVRPRDTSKTKVVNPLSEDFDLSKSAKSSSRYTEFTSPPLMDGLLKSVHDVLGPDAEPTPIQALALEHLLKAEPRTPEERARYQQWLLASETGSGKSMAYLLPVLQDLKLAELSGAPRRTDDPSVPRRAMNPRALVLAPTHELTRQLAGFAKELLHNVKLRVVCASRANTPSRKKVTAAKMAEAVMDTPDGDVDVSSEIIMRPVAQQRPVDLLVGTPSKILELARGRGWDYEQREAEDSQEGDRRSHRKITVGEPEMGLADVEWVIIDEADVLFDPDFQEATRMILADISAARGHPVPFEPELNLAPADAKSRPQPTPIEYPFNLVLTSATIPSSLAAYISQFHPSLTRLASPHLHRLPSTLKTEHFNWTGGNRDADIEHRLRRVWYEDLQRGQRPLSKVLVFCNKSARAENLGAYLREKGIANVALTRSSDARKRGSNHHLDGFLRVRHPEEKGESADASASTSAEAAAAPGATSMEQLKDVPHVMITTSLLSRGLDFAPDVKHVFIVDEPRNMVDFLHRAGRSGRAGEDGKVVVFGKSKGRGSEKARVVRQKVGALKA